MKTRYAILEPGLAIETDEPIEASRLATLEWVDVELKPAKDEARKMLDPESPEAIPYREFVRVLGPILGDFERVAVNGFKGAADMFVTEESAPILHDGSAGKGLPVNQLATLVYWTASILHEIDAEGVGLKTYDDMRKLALIRAADRMTVAPAARWAPQIYGRAVLFDDRVWF